MTKSTKILAATLTAIIGGAVAITNFSGEEVELQTGYSFYTENAPEDDLQRTILAPDGHRFTIANDLIAISELCDECEEEKNALQLEIASAIAELDLDIPADNPYVE